MASKDYAPHKQQTIGLFGCEVQNLLIVMLQPELELMYYKQLHSTM